MGAGEGGAGDGGTARPGSTGDEEVAAGGADPGEAFRKVRSNSISLVSASSSLRATLGTSARRRGVGKSLAGACHLSG